MGRRLLLAALLVAAASLGAAFKEEDFKVWFVCGCWECCRALHRESRLPAQAARRPC